MRVGGADSDISCDDLQETGLFETEQATTGTLALTATLDNYTDMDYAPGTYTVTIIGTATKSGQTQTSSYSFTLVDPCDPPTSLTPPTF